MSRAVVCLSASDSKFGKMIRGITRSNVNHSFIAFYSDNWKGWQALQVDGRGVVELTIEQMNRPYIEYYEFNHIDLMTALPKPAVRNMIGDDYDKLGVLGCFLQVVAWRTFGRKIGTPINNSGDLFCSEFCTSFLQNVDGAHDWIMDLIPAKTAPGGVEKYIGAPSLQEIFQRNPEDVSRVVCPWGD